MELALIKCKMDAFRFSHSKVTHAMEIVKAKVALSVPGRNEIGMVGHLVVMFLCQ